MKKIVMTELICVTLVVCSFVAVGCSSREPSKTEMGVVGGAALGAGVGAVVGNQVGSAGEGAAVGAAAGSLIGGVVANQQESREDEMLRHEETLRRQQRELERQRRELQELRRQQYYDRELRGYEPPHVNGGSDSSETGAGGKDAEFFN
jgi:uncharacterized protein YcfJ